MLEREINEEEVIKNVNSLLGENIFGKYLLASLYLFGIGEKFREHGKKLPEKLVTIKQRLNETGLEWCLKRAENAIQKGDYLMAKAEIYAAKNKFCRELKRDLPKRAYDIMGKINNLQQPGSS